MINIDEANSIAEGIELYGLKSKPFIVRDTLDFDFNYNIFKQNVMRDETTIYSTNKHTLKYIENINLINTLNDWENDKLEYNFIDSTLNQNILNYDIVKNIELKKKGIGLTMCSNNTYTPFHIDSTSQLGGGGWVYLYQGEKQWNFIEFFDAVNSIYNKVEKCLYDVNVNIFVKNNIPIYQCNMYSGDFIYFPPGWAHQVITSHKSIGLNGYMMLPSDQDYIERINQWYFENDNNPEFGILHRKLCKDDIDLHKKINMN
jgi:hypothetical protein